MNTLSTYAPPLHLKLSQPHILLPLQQPGTEPKENNIHNILPQTPRPHDNHCRKHHTQTHKQRQTPRLHGTKHSKTPRNHQQYHQETTAHNVHIPPHNTICTYMEDETAILPICLPTPHQHHHHMGLNRVQLIHNTATPHAQEDHPPHMSQEPSHTYSTSLRTTKHTQHLQPLHPQSLR